MERLTLKAEENNPYIHGKAYVTCNVKGCLSITCEANPPCERMQEVVDRLYDFENIFGDDYDLDRLRDLVEADRDGRCVVLPCKEGDKLRRDGIEFTADHWNLILTAFAEDKSTKSGKRVGLFGAKEAEAALKARDGE